jgi:hypothetical protein
MADAATPVPPPLRAWIAALAIGVPVLGLLLGQDANWDLRNYHLYGPHAWLHGRWAIDVAPAQMQSWHNPLADLPLYLLRDAPGWVGALWLTAPFVAALACLLLMYVRLAGSAATRGGLVALALVAATGASAFSALGTSFNDAFVAAGVLGAGWVLLRTRMPGAREWVVAGALLGAAAGLKLTAATYCVALAAAAAVAGPWRGAPVRLAWLALGGLAGFALTFGWWGWTLQGLHGSPVFPYFNDVLHAADAPPLAHGDLRFRPAGWLDVLLVPAYLLGKTQRYSEMVIRDPRLALGLVSGAWLAWKHRAEPAARALSAFFVVGLGLWAMQYGVYRYVLPLELLACLFLVLAIARVPRARTTVLVVATLAAAGWTDHPNWGRTRFGPDFASVAWPALPRDSMVVTAGWSPVAYAAIGLPDDVPLLSAYNNFMRPTTCSRMQAQVEARLRDHAGPLFLLREPAGDAEGEAQLAAAYGLSIGGACGTVESNLGTLSLCPLRRAPRPPTCAPSAAAPGR